MSTKSVGSLQLDVDGLSVVLRIPGYDSIELRRPSGVTQDDWLKFWNAPPTVVPATPGVSFNHLEAEKKHAEFEQVRQKPIFARHQ